RGATERVFGQGGDEDERRVGQRETSQRRRRRPFRGNDSQIHLTGFELEQRTRGVLRAELERDLGIATPTLREQPREQRVTGRHRTRDVEVAGGRFPIGRERPTQRVPALELGLREGSEPLAGVAQVDAAPIPDEQRMPDLFLHALYEARQRRRAHVQRLCRPPEVERAGEVQKGAEILLVNQPSSRRRTVAFFATDSATNRTLRNRDRRRKLVACRATTISTPSPWPRSSPSSASAAS